jgi:hypothetical protein
MQLIKSQRAKTCENSIKNKRFHLVSIFGKLEKLLETEFSPEQRKNKYILSLIEMPFTQISIE